MELLGSQVCNYDINFSDPSNPVVNEKTSNTDTQIPSTKFIKVTTNEEDNIPASDYANILLLDIANEPTPPVPIFKSGSAEKQSGSIPASQVKTSDPSLDSASAEDYLTDNERCNAEPPTIDTTIQNERIKERFNEDTECFAINLLKKRSSRHKFFWRRN